MCRMLGLVAARPVSPRVLLRDAPRSLAELSREHQDGWGMARWTGDGWQVERSTACAATCGRYARVVDHAPAELLIAHVRQKTVGPTSLANTHPFRRVVDGGEVVFAHNGTVRDVAELTARTSPARGAEVTGDTDSERLLAFVATSIDREGEVERGVQAAVATLHELHDHHAGAGGVGSINFLLSCGARLYAHRLGRSLHLLTRHGSAEARRTEAVVIASERLTDEPWTELADRTLLLVERDAARVPTVRHLR
ncbi:MAG: class II glutamine amidotransferase [Kofleriaceae bacterium]|nr:class II glutamine amidotransferase [Kofleriaceae bacterium]